MNNNLFNNYNLSDKEVARIISMFEKEINKNSMIMGKLNEDCKQEIIINIYEALTKNRNKWNFLKFFQKNARFWCANLDHI